MPRRRPSCEGVRDRRPEEVPMYPVHVRGRLDEPLSRWLWLVKWLLAIPHFVVLVFLWIAFAFLTVIAFFAILFTGRYPRGMFDFNVGVLRWTWRVGFYSYSALATDRYPPFSLGEEPDYPAGLDVPYPERLSRGLVLVKWWLLAIPHYIVVGILAGSGWFVWDAAGARWGGGGLITLLVLFAGVVLLFANRYPRGLFDFVMGLNRWAFRVVAYATLMRDEYPPFRLDQGGDDPGGTPATATAEPAPAPPTARPAAGGTGAGKVALLVIGSLLGLISLGLVAGGGVAIAFDQTQRNADGYVTSDTHAYRTESYALVSDRIDLDLPGPARTWRSLFGDVRVWSESDHPVFIGLAATPDAERYLGAVERERVDDLAGRREQTRLPGGSPSGPPGEQEIWAASAAGTGIQFFTWEVEDGDWTFALMNADASRGVDATLSVGATLPGLLWAGLAVLAGGILLLALAVLLIVLGTRSRPASPVLTP
ncbi:MAG: DUF4389 domain-containing protein [Thermoleophilia bacterium]|nr:DUF4389 domain-containing protein [Thermoleophilia bacterium]